MNRRSLIQCAPAAGMAALLAGAVPVIAQAQTETPVAVAFREWAKFYQWLNHETSGLDDHAFEEASDRGSAMKRAMFAMPAQSMEDVFLKLLTFTDMGTDVCSDHYGTPETILSEGMGLMGVSA